MQGILIIVLIFISLLGNRCNMLNVCIFVRCWKIGIHVLILTWKCASKCGESINYGSNLMWLKGLLTILYSRIGNGTTMSKASKCRVYFRSISIIMQSEPGWFKSQWHRNIASLVLVHLMYCLWCIDLITLVTLFIQFSTVRGRIFVAL